jgi:hypothetical protein
MTTEPTAYPVDPTDSDYDPTSVEVNRGREQGLGMGAKDLAYQADPTGGVPGGAAFGLGEPAGEGDTLIGQETQGDHFGQAGPAGKPDRKANDEMEDMIVDN